jgi:hypothetical protein
MALRRGEPIPATSRCRRTTPARGDRTNARISAERRTGKSGHQRPSDRPMKPPHRFGREEHRVRWGGDLA